MRERNLDRESQERLRYDVLDFVRCHGGLGRRQVLASPAAAEELGISLEELYSTVERLASESLLQYLGAGPKVRLTEQGIHHLDLAARRDSIRLPHEP